RTFVRLFNSTIETTEYFQAFCLVFWYTARRSSVRACDSCVSPVCDHKFAYVGSHNVLSSNTSYLDLASDEVGTLHTSPRNIQKLINCFETQPDLSS
ncbi:MAG: hypothetical protein KME25_11705, partial [Symplocastrum torsivum CPER-KK1]|nr:hypothetical protein [Symplocastrum torsivum CPER-KK1]